MFQTDTQSIFQLNSFNATARREMMLTNATAIEEQSRCLDSELGPQVCAGQVPVDRALLSRCANYAAAQAIVDRLSDAHFPVEKTSIHMRDLAFVEQVTGRLTWLSVLGRGLASGLMIGLFIGFFFGLFLIDPFAWGVMLLWSCVVGATIWCAARVSCLLGNGWKT